jgi:ribosome maturation factor RimP
MPGQHTENLFRRFKGEVVKVKTLSGEVFEGRIAEITNDYVSFSDISTTPGIQVYLFFKAVESLTISSSSN